MSNNRPVTRRRILGMGLVAASAAGLGLTHSAPAYADPNDYTDRAFYDAAEANFYLNGTAKPSSLNQDNGKLAWGQSYVLQSYMIMYKAFQDPAYLRLLVRNADQIFATRDSERGVTDYLGRSLPAWRAGVPYTASRSNLVTASLTPALQVRAAQGRSNEVYITISHDSPSTFSILVEHPTIADQTFSGLSMDPSSPDYFVRRVVDAAPTGAGVTVVDTRTDPTNLERPRTGHYLLLAPYYVFGVHTGMITFAIADFCAVVQETPQLQAEFGAKASAYLTMVEDAIAVHDNEWRETSAGLGWYIAERGAPVLFDGSDLPHNQHLALALTNINLYRATGTPIYADRAQKMLATFKSDLVATPDGSYVWSYWWSEGHFGTGYDQTDDFSDYNPAQSPVSTIEDTSHAVIELWTALAGLSQGWVFTSSDAAALAATFTDSVAISAVDSVDSIASTAQRVNGVSSAGTEGAHNRTSGNWAALTPWDGAILTHLTELFNDRQFPVQHGYTLCSLASLVAAAS